MADLNTRLRRSLPLGFVLLGMPTAPLAKTARKSLRAWAVPTAVAGVAALIAATLFVVIDIGGPSGTPLTHPRRTPGTSVNANSSDPDAASEVQSPAPSATASSTTPAKAVPNTKQGSQAAGTYRIRNTTLGSCLAPQGSAVVQLSCSDPTTGWKRRNSGGGFTLTSTSNGKCLSRGAKQAGVPWEGGSQYAVTTAPCGGPYQVWQLVQFAPGVNRLTNGDAYYLQADWSGLRPVTLKPSSFAGMAAQGWSVA